MVCSEGKALRFVQPQTEKFLFPREIHADRDIHRVFGDTSRFTSDMHHDAIHKHDRPDRFQPSSLPRLDFFSEIFGDLRHQRRRDLRAVQLLDDVLNVARRQPLGVQRQNLLIEARQPTLILAQQQRFKGSVAVAGNGQRQPSHVSLDRLRTGSVPPIASLRGTARRIRCGVRVRSRDDLIGRLSPRGGHSPQMRIELRVEHPFQRRFHQRSHHLIELFQRCRLARKLLCQIVGLLRQCRIHLSVSVKRDVWELSASGN